MADFFDDFSGTAGQLVVDRPGWTRGRGYYESAIALDGSGGVGYLVSADTKRALVDTGAPNHFIEVVVGSGFLTLGTQINAIIDSAEPSIELSGKYGPYLYFGGVISDSLGVVSVGDTIRAEYLNSTSVKVFVNGVLRVTKDLSLGDPRAPSNTVGLALEYVVDPAVSDLFRSFRAGALAAPAPPDTEKPVHTGTVTVDARSSSSITTTCPIATDNVGVTNYDVRINGGSWTAKGATRTHTHGSLSAGTSYTIEWTARDEANNRSTPPLSVSASTYAAGAMASTILLLTGPQDGNPKGMLYDLAGTVDPSAWLSYTIVSGPTPSGGVLTAQANGAFMYSGPAPATLVIQPAVNGVNTAETTTITLYDGGTPDTENPVLTGAITLVSKTASSITVSCPAGTDNIGVAAYEWSKDNGSTWVSGTTSQVFSGLTASTLYQIRVHARDAAGLTSTPDLALDVTTDAAAPIVLTGASLSVTPVWTTGAIVQGVAIALSGANLAVTPSFGTGAIVQLAPVVLTGANLTLTPVFSPGALVQNAVIALQGANLVVTPVFMAGSLVEAPLYVSMAPSTTSAIYRRDANRDSNPLTVFQKSEGDVLDFDIDFKREMTITEDDARGLNPVEYQAGAGITVLGAYWVPNLKRVKLWVTGGTENSQAVILVWLNTEAGRRLQVDVRVSVI